MPATTPNSPSKRKKIDKRNKPELMEEVRYHLQKEEEGRGIRSVRDDFETRLIQIERRLAEQEQYTRRECVDIVGLPENLKGEELEAAVLNVFEVAGVPMEKRDFHAIHRLRNTRVVIAKVCNRRDAIAILRNNNKKLRELSQEGEKKLKKFTLMNLCVISTNEPWVNAKLY